MIISTKKNFPIIGLTNYNALLSRNGDITVGYKCVFENLNGLSSNDFVRLNENFKIAFKALVPKTIIHAQTFFNFGTYRPGDIDLQSSSESFLGAANEQMLYEKKFKETTSYYYFTLVNKSPLKKSLTDSTIFKESINIDKRDISHERVSKFINGVENFIYSLGDGFNFSFNKLKDEDLLGSNNSLNVCERFMMCTQDGKASFKDIVYDNNSNRLNIGDKKVGIYNLDSVYSFNDYVMSYSADNRLSTERSFFPASLCKKFTHKVDGECIYNVIMYKETIEEVRGEVDKIIKQKRSLLTLSEENTKSLYDSESFLDNLLNDVSRAEPIYFNANLIYWATAENDFKTLKSNVETAFKSADLIPQECNEELPIVFMNSMPGNVGNFGKDQMILTYEMVGFSFLNFEETFSYDGKSALGLSMVNRNGARTIVDIFAESNNSMQKNDITGYNFFCLGPTGSGKSVTMNYLVRWAVENDAFVMLVDVGHSYENLCKYYLKGKYLAFGDGQPLEINPFVISGRQPSDRRKQMILKILLKAWKGDAIPTKIEENSVYSSIVFFYNYVENEHKQNAKTIPLCFNSYYEYMQGKFREEELPKINTSSEFNINHFLDVLGIFYIGGTHEKVLNAHMDIDLANERFIVFELDNIKGDKTLFPLVVLYIIGTYEEILKEKKNQRKYLIIEEAWKAIMSDLFAEYIKECYKTSRKFNGTIGMVTQEYNDLLGSQVILDTIISQSDVKILLSMSKDIKKIDRLADGLSLTEKDVSLLLSLNRDLTEDDKFRELYIKWDKLSGVWGILLSAKEYWTYTTKAREKNLVKYLHSHEFGKNYEKTINFLSKLTDENQGNYQKVIDECNSRFNVEIKVKENPRLIEY